MLADVSDKVPSILKIAAFNIVLAAIAFYAATALRRLVVVVVVLAALWLYLTLREFAGDQYFNQAVTREMGSGYLLYLDVTSGLPLIAALEGLLIARTRADPSVLVDNRPNGEHIHACNAEPLAGRSSLGANDIGAR